MLIWLGLVGAWLLVGGSIFQAMLELRGYDVVHERVAVCARGLATPPRISVWWWLLPPVYIYRSRRRSERHFRAVIARLAATDVRDFVALYEKAIGWFLVAGGGVLLAAKETLFVAASFGLGRLAGGAVTVLFVAASFGLAKLQLSRSQAMARDHEPG